MSEPAMFARVEKNALRTRLRQRRGLVLLLFGSTLVCSISVGCQDGPLYALKVANPYYSMREWKKDEAIGVTDHERRKQLTRLADTIGTMPTARQKFWSQHLEKLIENDQSPEMRCLAVRAAGAIADPSALEMIEKGLDDESTKVRMQACRSLGSRQDDESARMLAAALGSETSQDVRHAAMIAMGHHRSPIVLDSLRVALADRNPATQSLAMESLRETTGKNYGNDPQTWIAALDGKPVAQAETRIADRVRGIFDGETNTTQKY